MASKLPPGGKIPPSCGCGCGQPVNWSPGKGWSSYLKGHASRGKQGPRKGAVFSDETRKRMSLAAKHRYAGKRRRDTEKTPGIGVYATLEYREARAALEGQPCSKCGSTDDVGAHAAPDAKGQQPPPGEKPPLCACGCGQPVAWKRVRGWAKYRKGHGAAKVPGGTRLQEPPLCKCGCGEPVKFRFGKGWSEYKRGHRQRVEGGYRSRR